MDRGNACTLIVSGSPRSPSITEEVVESSATPSPSKQLQPPPHKHLHIRAGPNSALPPSGSRTPLFASHDRQRSGVFHPRSPSGICASERGETIPLTSDILDILRLWARSWSHSTTTCCAASIARLAPAVYRAAPTCPSSPCRTPRAPQVPAGRLRLGRPCAIWIACLQTRLPMTPRPRSAPLAARGERGCS
jgi:hypothetical protein